jgi:hypothetical protein
VFDVLITVFALHFRSTTIKIPHRFRKVAMMEQAILKASNEIVHGAPVPP